MKSLRSVLSATSLYSVCQSTDDVASRMVAGMSYHEDDPDTYLPPEYFSAKSFEAKAHVFLSKNFPKQTPLHLLIEECVVSLCEAHLSDRSAIEIRGEVPLHLRIIEDLRITHLDIEEPKKRGADGSKISLLEAELRAGIPDLSGANVLNLVSDQVFYVLFGNRRVLQNINVICAEIRKRHQLENAARVYVPRWVERAAFLRDKGLCTVCGKDVSGILNPENKVHYDHIVPLAMGGINCVTNIQVLCSNCNLSKGSRNTGSSNSYVPWY